MEISKQEREELIEKRICPECRSDLEFVERVRDEYQHLFEDEDYADGVVPYYTRLTCFGCNTTYYISDEGKELHSDQYDG